MAEAKKKSTLKVEATFDKETKRKRRYVVNDNEHGVVGTIYTDKDGDAPSAITIDLS